ncbi:MAG TPA: hypothetical protein VF534_03775 [Paraburkholderia sp.]
MREWHGVPRSGNRFYGLRQLERTKRIDRDFVAGQLVETATDKRISVYNATIDARIVVVAWASKDEAVGICTSPLTP